MAEFDRAKSLLFSTTLVNRSKNPRKEKKNVDLGKPDSIADTKGELIRARGAVKPLFFFTVEFAWNAVEASDEFFEFARTRVTGYSAGACSERRAAPSRSG